MIWSEVWVVPSVFPTVPSTSIWKPSPMPYSYRISPARIRVLAQVDRLSQRIKRSKVGKKSKRRSEPIRHFDRTRIVVGFTLVSPSRIPSIRSYFIEATFFRMPRHVALSAVGKYWKIRNQTRECLSLESLSDFMPVFSVFEARIIPDTIQHQTEE